MAVISDGRRALFLVAVLCVVPAAPARGDGGTLRYSTRTRGLDISVFTDPTPPRTGTVDVSVFVRPVPSGETRPMPAFQVCAYPVAAPSKRVCEPATAEVATNKLFRAAQLELNQPGLWQIEIVMDSADGQSVAGFQLPVESSYPDWVSNALWVGVPAIAVVLFIAHRRLVRRREKQEVRPIVMTPPRAVMAVHGGS
jgi:hypothetical protein